MYGVAFPSPKGLLVLGQEAQTAWAQTRSAAELWCGWLTPDSGPGPGVSWRLAGVRRGPGVPVWCGVVTVWEELSLGRSIGQCADTWGTLHNLGGLQPGGINPVLLGGGWAVFPRAEWEKLGCPGP